jgi:Restriction endonuclease
LNFCDAGEWVGKSVNEREGRQIGQNKGQNKGKHKGRHDQWGAAHTGTLRYTAWGLIALGIVIVGVAMAFNTPAHEGATFGLLVIGGLVVFGGLLMHWLDRMDGGIAKEEAERPKRRHLLQNKRSRRRRRTAEDDFSVFEEVDDLADPAPVPAAQQPQTQQPRAQPTTVVVPPPGASLATSGMAARIDPVLRQTPPVEQRRTIAVQRPPASAMSAMPAVPAAPAATAASFPASAQAQSPRAVIQAVDTSANTRPAQREHSDLITAAIAKAEAARAQQLAQVAQQAAQAAEMENLRAQAQAAFAAQAAAEEAAHRNRGRGFAPGGTSAPSAPAHNAQKAAALQAARADAEAKARFSDLPLNEVEPQYDAVAEEAEPSKGLLARFADRIKRPLAGRPGAREADNDEVIDDWAVSREDAETLEAPRRPTMAPTPPLPAPAPPVLTETARVYAAPVVAPTAAPLRPPVAPPVTPPAPAAQAPADTDGEWSEDMLIATDWRSFENMVEALFRQAGFRSRILSLSEDGGADIGLFSRNQPGSPASVLHCHHSGAERIGVSRVRALRHVMSEHQVPRGQLVISGRYTSDAKAYAREHHIRLMDGPAILALIRQRSPEQQQVLLELLQEGLA